MSFCTQENLGFLLGVTVPYKNKQPSLLRLGVFHAGKANFFRFLILFDIRFFHQYRPNALYSIKAQKASGNFCARKEIVLLHEKTFLLRV